MGCFEALNQSSAVPMNTVNMSEHGGFEYKAIVHVIILPRLNCSIRKTAITSDSIQIDTSR
jgi:hypothetical protein